MCRHQTGNLPYFRVLRQDGILFSGLLKNCQFALSTLAGTPIVFLQEGANGTGVLRLIVQLPEPSNHESNCAVSAEFEVFTYRYTIYVRRSVIQLRLYPTHPLTPPLYCPCCCILLFC